VHVSSVSSPSSNAVVKRIGAMQNFSMRRDAEGRYTRTPQQDLARAELLHRSFPNNVTEQAASATAKQVAAHERRAWLITQLHKQATGAADESAWQKILKARIDKDARRRKITAWLFAGTVFIVAFACFVALFWL
jgi:hypothetical protein